MNKTTNNLLADALGQSATVTANGVTFAESDMATVGTALVKLVKDGKIQSDLVATRHKGLLRIKVLDVLTADADAVTIRVAKPKDDADTIPHFTDKDRIRFMAEVLKVAKQHCPNGPVYDEKGNLDKKPKVYPYAAVEELGQTFKRTDGETVMPWQWRTSLESFNAGKTGHKPYGNLREFLGQAVKYANGNTEKVARLDTMVVPKGTADGDGDGDDDDNATE